MATTFDDIKKMLEGVDKALEIGEKVSQRAERWHTRYKISAALLFLVSAALLLLEVAPTSVVLFFVLALIGISILGVRTRVVEARVMLLRDDANTTRAALMSDNGHTMLTFYDSEQRPRCALGVREDGAPAVHLLGPNGRPTLALTDTPAGGPTVALIDEQGTDPVAWLRIGEAQQPILHLNSKQGDDQLTLTILPDGTPGILMRASDAEAELISSVSDGGTPYVMLKKDGERLWSTPSTHETEQ